MTAECKRLMQESGALDAVANYLCILMEQGDYLNDFLVDVPECGRPLIEVAGRLLAVAMGF